MLLCRERRKTTGAPLRPYAAAFNFRSQHAVGGSLTGGARKKASLAKPASCREAFLMSRLRNFHFLTAPRDITCECDERRLTHPEVSAMRPPRSGSWKPLGAKRAFTVLTQSTLFYVRTHRASAAVLRTSPGFRGSNTLGDFHATSSFPFASRTRSPCAASPSSDNFLPETRLHSSAARAGKVATTPSAAEDREASTCGLNSEFRHWARSFTTSLSATRAARRGSRLQRLSNTNFGPCGRSTASAGGRLLPPVSVTGAAKFPFTYRVKLACWFRAGANRGLKTSSASLR